MAVAPGVGVARVDLRIRRPPQQRVSLRQLARPLLAPLTVRVALLALSAVVPAGRRWKVSRPNGVLPKQLPCAQSLRVTPPLWNVLSPLPLRPLLPRLPQPRGPGRPRLLFMIRPPLPARVVAVGPHYAPPYGQLLRLRLALPLPPRPPLRLLRP